MWNNTQHAEADADPYARAREEMIEHQLRRRGIVMHRVLEAMREVPRHLFVGHEHQEHAYADEALPSSEGQTISQPFMVAVMTQELDLRHGQRVLEIGTGTGYQTAVLAYLVGEEGGGGMVYTIEVVPALAEGARRRLEAMEVRNVRYFVGDGSAGWPAEEGGEPEMFDRILVTAGAPEVPAPLVEQLRTGGVLIVPIGRGETQTLVKVVKLPQGLEQTEVLACRFVPLLGRHAWNAEEYERSRG
ncbi:MAG TPA: protein-L-isoaspartate(D-aspartate) O-methyltransferase [Phycisphaerae bacterium]|nr:protein-L-isoaspartate(D-aspartate) O-methyltransferase [Phycisphaerae bacterium]